MNISLAWIRREMRLHDNAVLHTALSHPYGVQPVFVFDVGVLSRFNRKDDRRLVFLAETLCHMHRQLAQKGGGMLVLAGQATAVIPKLAYALNSPLVVAAEDCEPACRSRDIAVSRALGEGRFRHVLDHLLLHPDCVQKDDGTPYKVYTPFSRAVFARLSPPEYAAYELNDTNRYAQFAKVKDAASQQGLRVLDPSLGVESMLAAIGYDYKADARWKPDAAHPRLRQFIESRLINYKTARDRVDWEGTSALSPYLRFGLLSVRECMRAAESYRGEGADTWRKELVWREFYAHILYHFPEVVNSEFQASTRGLHWSDNKEHLAAFCQGRTGFPIVDAAMRQLLAEGWMHNRARMIVASFAAKDLHLDWRLGENHFAQYLMDYDLASNNGGWQWASSVGTDAQPYFRVFNPLLQSKKFDPDGVYIRRYVPELSRLSGNDVHAPSGLLRPRDYPEPLVDHAEAKAHAIAMFKREGAA